MKKFVCTVCNHVHFGDAAPSVCPICHESVEKYKEIPYFGLDEKPKWYERFLNWFRIY